MDCQRFFNVKEIKPQMDLVTDMITKHFENLSNLPVEPDVKPGFVREIIPTEMPFEGELFEKVIKDVEKVAPKTLQWSHPGFFGYFPYALHHSIIAAEAICTAFGSPNFNWNVSQSSHEVEKMVAEWLQKMLALDDKYYFKNGGVGAITNSVTESGFMSLNLAKYMKVKELNLDPFDCRRLKFVAYYPETNSSWAKKMLILKDINIHRALTVYMDEETKQYKIDNNELVQIIKEDIENGLIPLWYGSNFGSTDCCVIDEYEVVGPILKEHNIYFHVDAAYLGMLLSCEEYRVKGLEYANSISLNLNKTGLSGISGTFSYFDNRVMLEESSGNISNIIYKSKFDEEEMFDSKNMIPGFSKRTSSFKMYILFRVMGIKGFQDYVRAIVKRGEFIEEQLKNHKEFEFFCTPRYGLVTFRIKLINKTMNVEEYNKLNLEYYNRLRSNTDIGYITSSIVKGFRFLRLNSGNPSTTEKHITDYIQYMKQVADEFLREYK